MTNILRVSSRRLIFGVVIVSASTAVAGPADSLADAQLAIERIDFDLAYSLLQKSLEGGGHSPEQLATVYRLLGEVAATLERADEATQHFARWLAVSPTAMLAAGESPKIVRPFEAARSSETALETKVSAQGLSDGRTRVEVSLVRDSLEIVNRIRIGDDRPIPIGRERPIVATARGATVVVRFFDRFGNLVVERSVAVPKVLAQIRRPLWRHPWVWGALAVGTLTAATTLSVRAKSAQDRVDVLRASSGDHEFREFESATRTLRRRSLYANVAIGAGVLASTAFVASLLLGPKQDPRGQLTVRFSPAAVNVRLDF